MAVLSKLRAQLVAFVAMIGRFAKRRLANAASRDAAVAALAVGATVAVALPLFASAGASLFRTADLHANEVRVAGLDVLERERPLQLAIRALRTGAIARRNVPLANRFAVDRALERLGDVVAAGPLAADLRARLAALHAAWQRVPDRGRDLGAIDALLAADEDFVSSVEERASLGAGPDSVSSEGMRLYVSALPALEDRSDQERNLVLAAAASRRVPNGMGAAVEIFAAQARREYTTALASAERIRSLAPRGAGVLEGLRHVGYAFGRFDAAIRYTLRDPKGLRHNATLVSSREAALERELEETSLLDAGIVRSDLETSLVAQRRTGAQAFWMDAFIGVSVLVISALGTLAVRSRLRAARVRAAVLAEERCVEVADRLAASEAQLQAIFERSTLGVAIFDTFGKLSRTNPALETMLGRPDAAGIGARNERFADLVAGSIDGFCVQTQVSRDDASRVHQTDFSLVRDAAGEPRLVLALVRDITEQTANDRRLQYEATHDPLSRLPNRAFLLDRMRSAYFGDVPPAGVCAVVYLDVDGCEPVSLGAAGNVGDEAVLAVVERLAVAIELNTFVARFDGDAYVVLLDGLLDRDAVHAAVERIVRRLAQPIHIGERELSLSVHAGIAIVDRPYREPLDIVRDAEVAMRDARRRGRSAVATFSAEMRDRTVRKTAVGSALRHAVERSQLHLEYQPVVFAADRTLHGFEALLRFEHPELGQVSPAEFIPLAEESGVIVPIGRWVFDTACAQLAKWRADGRNVDRLSIAINASVAEIVQPDYAAYVQRTIGRHGVAASQIVVEVTESAVLESGRFAAGSLEALKALGVGLAIDDFGTGYSSLRYLLEFPFSQLKIDASFVRGVDGGLASEPIVSTLVTLARAVGVTTVAEGVETELQAQRLIALGVDELQGYLFSRPISPAAALAYLNPARLRLIGT